MPRGPAQIVGILRKSNNNFLVTDVTTNVTDQLRAVSTRGISGNVIDAAVGKCINVTGETDATSTPVDRPATQVMEVTALTENTGGCTPTASRMAPMHTVQVGHGVVAAIVGGGAAAAMFGGLAAAGTSQDKKVTSP